MKAMKILTEKLKQYQSGALSREDLKKWLDEKAIDPWETEWISMLPEEIIAAETYERLQHNIEPCENTFRRVVEKVLSAFESGCIETRYFYKIGNPDYPYEARKILSIAERVCSRWNESETAALEKEDAEYLAELNNQYIHDYHLLNHPEPRKSIAEILVSDLALMLYDVYYFEKYGESGVPSVKVQREDIKLKDVLSGVSLLAEFLNGKRAAFIHISGCGNNYSVYVL